MASTFVCKGRHGAFMVFLVSLLLAIFLPSSQATRNVPYRAAVYEHVVESPPAKVVSRDEAVENMMKNIQVYEKQAQIAASKGAKIIVFPEYGVLGIHLNRTTVKSYLEEIPDPRCVSWNPSKEPNAYKGTEIQRELSRIAKENKIYMVVNMGTKVPCTTAKNSWCPPDGQHQFNTNVVYSANGTLVAVYHKRNLYIDLPFEPAPEPEYVTFDTPFGRFGTVICFDLMFKEPTFVLLEKYKVRNLAYPTAWVKIKPFYRSLMVHSGFARANSINILASDLHAVKHLAHGSGLYSPEGAQAYFYNTNPGKSKLLIADMDAIAEETDLSRSSNTPKINPPLTDNEKLLNGSILGLEFLFKPLNDIQGSVNVCNANFCCSLDYEMQQKTEKYALGIGNGFLHVENKKLYVQTCTLSKCENEKCDAKITGANTIFQRFTLSGQNFDTSQIVPRVVAMNESSYVFVDQEWTYNHTGRIYMERPMSLPLHSAVLDGWVYDRDLPLPDTSHKGALPKCLKETKSSSCDIKSHLALIIMILPLISIFIQAKI